VTTYRSAPVMQSNYARGKAFPTAQEALRHTQTAADAFSIGYAVYECLDGRPKRLATFPPGPATARTVNPLNALNRS
jgi:hypothetical protein